MTRPDDPRQAPREDAPPSETGALEAVLFDMDGVVTDTADAHAGAWKRLFDAYLQRRAEARGEEFVPFDAADEYRRHVDGRPRYDGVEAFLRARSIELPRGDPGDAPDAETVCGLGNRKNRYFLEWLAEHRVRTYATTVTLIQALRAAGVRVAVFSASRNCEAVLRNAGVLDLFDARVDGNDLERRGLPGKPDPAMLEEAAARLGASPERTAVVEDSVAGVRAGARGGFAPVVGVDRGDYGDDLAAAGANLVVGDPGELALDADGRLVPRYLARLPSALARWAELRRRLGDAAPALFLDYDGTLTPIVDDPERAELGDDMRATLAALAERWPVAVISGRSVADLRARVGLDGLVYAGSHGFEMEGPGIDETAERAEEFLPALDAAEQALRARLAGVAGHIVERKPFDVSVHYRRVAAPEVDDVARIVDEVLADHPQLRKGYGKKVFQVQPRIDWDKGRAVLRLLERLGLDDGGAVPIYIGDDHTDEDVFRALAGRGVGIAVRGREGTTAADYALDDPADVARFLEDLRANAAVPECHGLRQWEDTR